MEFDLILDVVLAVVSAAEIICGIVGIVNKKPIGISTKDLANVSPEGMERLSVQNGILSLVIGVLFIIIICAENFLGLDRFAAGCILGGSLIIEIILFEIAKKNAK